MMNAVNKKFRKILSFAVICMIILTSMFPSFSVRTSAEEQVVIETPTQIIDKFDINIIGGAVNNGTYADPDYVCTPAVADKDVEFARYQIDYSITAGYDGGGDIEAGNFNITLPAHVRKNRDNNYTDYIDLSIPHESEVSDLDGNNVFVYREEGDKVVIYNRLTMSSAEGGSIQFRYCMGQNVYEYTDMSRSDDVTAELRIIKGEDEKLYTNDSAVGVTLDTFATLSSTTKESYYSNTFLSNWNSSWGNYADFGIDDPSAYYYCVWKVYHYISATQPFVLTYDETVTGDYGNVEFLGVKWSGKSKYTSGGTSPVIKLNTSVNTIVENYVLTKHPKADYPTDVSYKIYNTVNATLDPIDHVDPDMQGTASATATYTPPTPHYPTFGADFYKYNHYNYDSFYRNYIANYQLDDFLNDEIDEITENIDYHVHTYGYVYPWTYVQSDDPDESKYMGYGKKPVTYEIIDDQFYFDDSIDSADNIPDDSQLLTGDDYEITDIYFYYYARGAVWNENTMQFDTTSPVYSADDAIYFYAKFGIESDWTAIGVYHLNNDAFEQLSDKVSGFSNKKISFVEDAGCTGYKVVTSNAFYYTNISATPYCRIKRSQRILDLIADRFADPSVERKVWMTNVAKGRIYSGGIESIAEENIIFSRGDFTRDYIIGCVKETKLKKSSTFTSNNKLNRIATVGWKVEMFEGYLMQNGSEISQAYIPQDSGVFYDLIPAGGEVDLGTVAVATGVDRYMNYLKDSQFEASKIMNYNNSGRTLLIVKVKAPTKSAYVLTYSTKHSWESLFDYTAYARNSVAYETGNSKLAEGRPDDGGTITDAPIMADLDPDTDDKLFAYTEYTHKIDILLAVNSGLNKRVKSYYDDDFKKTTIVRQNQIYSYRLRFSTDFSTKAHGLIMVDNLESFTSVEDGIVNLWNGTLNSVDVSMAVKKGIAPVVYLSESFVEVGEGIDILSDPKWKRMDEFGDISRAKAVAIDLRKDQNGNDYLLAANDSVVVYLYMMSASRDPVQGEFHDAPPTHNSVHMYSTLRSAFDSEFSEQRFNTWSYDTVDFRIMSDLNILKLDANDHTVPVEGISFRLQGTSAYGTEYDSILESDSFGRLTFKDIEMGSYRLSEYQGSNDYLKLDGTMDVTVNDDGSITVDGETVAEGLTYTIDDPPRIHTDIQFNKKDIRQKWKIIPGVRFHLEGTSDYGNEINLDAVSDENGVVTFDNIELGTYTMKEIATVEGYVLSRTEYEVIVDKDALFSISNSTLEKDGTLTVYNEPYHSFTVHKEGYYENLDGTHNSVSGAVFNLSGTSDYGTEVDDTKTTRTNGNITFTNLEAGTYVLYEVSAPEGYICDPTKRVVTVSPDGTVTVSGSEKNSSGYFVIMNKEDSFVTVSKYWVDNETNVTRSASPLIHVGIEDTSDSAYFGGTLQHVLSRDYIKGFKPTEENDEYVQTLIDNGTAVRIDDGSTDKRIYAWAINNSSAQDYRTVYWWTDSAAAYITDEASRLWKDLKECTTIDVTGINFSKLTDMSRLFYGCTKLTTVTGLDAIDTSNVIDMSYLFYDCRALKNEVINYISEWDVSSVEDMSYMFYYCSSLTTIELTQWVTSNVTDMNHMFYYCNKLTTLDVSNFDTTNVTDMSYMFYYCQALTTLDVSSFVTSNVTDMSYMFYYCQKLQTIDVSEWVTSNVTDMSYMFYYCLVLATLDVSEWVTSNVTDMSYMFDYCQALTTLDVSEWVTSNVTDMNHMFYYCKALTTLDISNFDTTNVTDMSYMFFYCQALTTLDVSEWVTSNVTDMNHMFYYCQVLTTLDVSDWNTPNVTDMSFMFYGCEKIVSLDLSGWDTSKVKNMSCMFYGCNKLTTLVFGDYPNTPGDLFDTSEVRTMKSMFYGCSSLRDVDLHCFNTSKVMDMSGMFYDTGKLSEYSLGTMSNWDTSNVTNMSVMFYLLLSSYSDNDFTKVDALANWNTSKVTNMRYMFLNRKNLADITGLKTKTVDGKLRWDVSNVKNMENMFSGCNISDLTPIKDWDTSHVTNMHAMFSHLSDLSDLTPIKDWDTSNVTTMEYLFYYCTGITDLTPIKDWDTSHVTNMGYMFCNCTSLSGLTPIKDWDTSSVTNMLNLFSGCSGITDLTPIKDWNTSAVKNMYGLFSGCSGITDLTPIKDWNTSAVTNMQFLFSGCSGITDLTPIKDWNTSAVTDMQHLFSGCSGITDISPLDNWNVSKVTNMASMFYGCNGLTSFEMTNWDTSKVQDMTSMFNYCTNIVSIDVSCFDTSSVKSTVYMFGNCSSLVKIFASERWDMSKVTSSNFMFASLNNLNSDGGAAIPSNTASYSYNNCLPYATIYDAVDNPNGFLRYKAPPASSGGSGGSGGSSIETDAAYINTASKKLTNMTAASNILAFKPYDNTNNDAITVYESSSTKMKLDDGTTACVVYAWLADDGTVYWWSDADVVYLLTGVYYSNNSSLWYNLSSCTYIDVTGLSIIKASTLNNMFYYCRALAEIDGLETWTINPTLDYFYAEKMFYNCESLEDLDGFENLDFSKLSDHGDMFYGCKKLKNLDFLINWYNKPARSMFEGCTDLENIDGISGWTCAPSDYMFSNCKSLESLDALSGWCREVDVYSSKTGVFYGCTNLRDIEGLKNWDARFTSYNSFFYNCEALEDVSALKNWKMQGSLAKMFYGCSSLQDISELSGWDTSKVTSMEQMFYGCKSLQDISVLNSWNLPNVTTMDNMFGSCSGIDSIVLDNATLSSLTNCNALFSSCSLETTTGGVTTYTGLRNVQIINWNAPHLSVMDWMFSSCKALKTVIGLENIFSSDISSMSNMFYSCYSLEEVSDLSGLYTKNLIRIDGMFRYCKSLETLDLSGFYTSNLTYLQELFSGCTNLREITGISNWNTSNVTNMAYVFADCSSLVTLDLSGWSTANVTSIYEMFYNCRSLKTVNVSSRWNTDKMTGNNVFYGCNSIVGGNGTVYSSANRDYRYAHVDEEGNPGYLTYKKVIRIVEVADSDDTNCELIKTDDNTWQYVFSDMAPGLQYYAWEDKMDDYKSVNMLGSGDFEYAKAENGAAAITNTTTINPPTFGSIQVTKNVLNKDGTDITSAADKAKDFLFTVTLNDADNNPVADNTMFSAVKSAGGEESEISVIFKDGAASFRLADDESLSIVDVPTGYSYSVTETADEEYDTTYSDSTGAVEADMILYNKT